MFHPIRYILKPTLLIVSLSVVAFAGGGFKTDSGWLGTTEGSPQTVENWGRRRLRPQPPKPIDSLKTSSTNLHAEVRSDKRTGEATYRHAVVAADHPLASAAGLEILKKGGNVVDAAVATSFALSVLRCESCGIGGGGFMVIYDAKNRKSVALDYRERAPAKANDKMYLQSKDKRASRTGHLATAVPGTVAGLCYAQKHYGKLDLKTVLAPAIRLAKEGVKPDRTFLASQRRAVLNLQRNSDYRTRFNVFWESYLNNGKPRDNGGRFYSPQYQVLKLIAEHGANGFYKGPVAEAIAKESQRGGGLITLEDLANTEPIVRKPIVGEFAGKKLLCMPPPSSGGVAIVEILNILSAYGEKHPSHSLKNLKHNSPEYLHLVAEAMKHAFADRAEFLGDTDFVNVPIRELIDKKYAAQLAATVDVKSTKPYKFYGKHAPVNDAGTSHFSVIDSQGNAVACTETVNTGYGSYVVVPEYGILLNNQMDDFAAVPGQPNAFGLIQSKANAVAARKKPLSSMSPTIVLENGKAKYVAGASGGPIIISATLQVLLNMMVFEMTPQQAINQPRIHHQWLPDTLYVEKELLSRVGDDLKRRKHKVIERNGLATVQAASRSADGLRAGSDPRKGGKPAGH